jgi:hypothetical protein
MTRAGLPPFSGGKAHRASCVTSAPPVNYACLWEGGSTTTPPDPTETEGPGRRMMRGREAPPGEHLGKLGQHPPLVEKCWLNPNWRTGGNALRDWPGGEFPVPGENMDSADGKEEVRERSEYGK